MLEIMYDVPDNVIAATASGKVSGDDYEKVLIPLVEEKLKKYDKLRLLYNLGSEFSGYEAGAMWDDAKVGFAHLTHWEKIAVVTDDEWITRAIKAFAFLIPGEVKLYGNSQLDEAKIWISQMD
ncbi:MAG: STAS/SEC14 domain-containing protein [Caldilineales bacterium]|nr:STAS/SEC14 domain-containing protein [Caldilineales bacterium]